AAQRLAARPEQLPVGQLRLLCRVVVPVVRAGEQLAERGRDVDFARLVRLAGLEQGDAATRVAGQPVGQNAAGRAGSNHNVVVLLVGHGGTSGSVAPDA